MVTPVISATVQPIWSRAAMPRFNVLYLACWRPLPQTFDVLVWRPFTKVCTAHARLIGKPILHPQPHPKQVLIIRAGLHDFSPGALKKIMSQSAQFIAVQPAPGPAVATAGAPPGGLPGVAYNPTAQQGTVVLQVSYVIIINIASKKEEASIYSYTWSDYNYNFTV